MNCHPHGRSGRTVQEIWEDFSLSFTPAVKEVVEFAKHIPGFRELSQHDQVSLLKAGTFEVGSLPAYCLPILGTSYQHCVFAEKEFSKSFHKVWLIV